MIRTHRERVGILRTRLMWVGYGGKPRRIDVHVRDDGTVGSMDKHEHRKNAAEEQLATFGRALSRISLY